MTEPLFSFANVVTSEAVRNSSNVIAILQVNFKDKTVKIYKSPDQIAEAKKILRIED